LWGLRECALRFCAMAHNTVKAMPSYGRGIISSAAVGARAEGAQVKGGCSRSGATGLLDGVKAMLREA
jgi:hypothetical protein